MNHADTVEHRWFQSYRNPHASNRLCEVQCRVVAVNDPFVFLDYKINVHQYDSVHGRSDGTVAMCEVNSLLSSVNVSPQWADHSESLRFDIHVFVWSRVFLLGSVQALGFTLRKLEAHKHASCAVLVDAPGILTIAVRQLDGPCGGQNSEFIILTQEQRFLHVSRFKALSRGGTPGHRRDRGCATCVATPFAHHSRSSLDSGCSQQCFMILRYGSCVDEDLRAETA